MPSVEDAPTGRQPKAYRWRVVDAVEASELSPGARHLLVTMCLRCGGHRERTGQLGEFSPSLSELSRITGWKLTAVKKYLGELEQAGWLIRDQPPVKLQRRRRRGRSTPSESPASRPTCPLCLGRHTT